MNFRTRFNGDVSFEGFSAATITATAHDAVGARSLARLAQGLRSGAALSASAVAALMGRNAYDLIREAAESTSSLAVPMDERLQAHLRNVVRTLDRAYLVHGSMRKALHWYHHGVVAELGNRTPEWCTLHGQAEALCRVIGSRPVHQVP
ncbi:MAG: hypothetical protein V4864_11650 [Pseudomonadota bacterium]